MKDIHFHLCSCYEKRNLNLHGLMINNKHFSDKFVILKFLFRELEQFYSSLSSEKLFFEFKLEFGKIIEFFRVRVRSPGQQNTDWLNFCGMVIVIDNMVIIITFHSPSSLGQETVKGPFGLRVKLPSVYYARPRLHTVPLTGERQAG